MKNNGRNFRTSLFLLVCLFLVNTVAGESHCLPDWNPDAPILIDKDVGRIEFASGNSFPVEAVYRYDRTCKNPALFVLTWQALRNNVVINDIVFGDIHAKKTTATVALGAKTGEVTIRATLSFADDPDFDWARKEREVTISVVSKSQAPKIVLSYGQIESLIRFDVGIEGSKAYGSDNNFIQSCSLVLKDEWGNIVDSDKIDTVFGKAMPLARLTPKNPGIYTITATCSDSLGSTGTVTETIPVEISDKKRNKPYIVANSSVSCYLGEKCVIDFSRTNDFGEGIDMKYSDITKGDSRNVPLILCGSRNCELNLTRLGVYKIKLVARFDYGNFVYSDSSEKIVSVMVSQQTQQPTVLQTPCTCQTPQPQHGAGTGMMNQSAVSDLSSASSEDKCKGFRCEGEKSPGAGGFVVILAFAFFVRRMREQK